MEKIRIIEMVLAYQELSKIKRPSKRVKAVIAKLEDRICNIFETMQSWSAIENKID